MALLVALALFGLQVGNICEGFRRKVYTGSPSEQLTEAIQKVISVQGKSMTRDARKEAFEGLRRSVLHTSSKAGFVEELEKYSMDGNSVVVLNFLLDIYKAFPLLINRVEETLERLLQCDSWADMFAIMYSTLDDQLLPRTVEKLQIEGDDGILAKAEFRRAEEAKAQREADQLQKVQAIRTFPEFNSAMEKVSNMADRAQFVANSEVTFKALRVMVRRTKTEDLPTLLATADDGVPALTWEFLLQFGKRNFYKNQIAEVVLLLMRSPKWRQELLALPDFQEKLKLLPVQAQAAFRLPGVDFRSRRYAADADEDSKMVLANALANGIKVAPPKRPNL